MNGQKCLDSRLLKNLTLYIRCTCEVRCSGVLQYSSISFVRPSWPRTATDCENAKFRYFSDFQFRALREYLRDATLGVERLIFSVKDIFFSFICALAYPPSTYVLWLKPCLPRPADNILGQKKVCFERTFQFVCFACLQATLVNLPNFPGFFLW